MTNAILTVLLLIGAVMVFLGLAFNARKRSKKTTTPFPGTYRLLLNNNVAFYKRLDNEGKINFENRVQHFLSTIRITGIKATVEDIDRVLIGASAVIPIYAFPGWEYINLREVLLYPGNVWGKF